ncbi:MAG: DUF2306 domain-containing protein [Gammaproteobacteria bacterium]|nr:DUF2306 domain-containing protein [Gammaproteobacteria bacterium]
MSVAQPLSRTVSGTWEARCSRLLAMGFLVLCVGYAVLAADYFISFAAGRPGLWVRLLAALVSEEFAYGPGSVQVDQHVAYTDALRFMLMHTTMGAVSMALGPFQFIAAFRRRYPAAHRVMGRLYLGGVVLSMIGGLAYLGTTAFGEVFSGKPFAIALLGLDLAVLWTAWLAYRAIRARAVLRHQAWMAFNFGLVCATPGLRMLWLMFGWSVPAFTQAQANLAITTFLLPMCLLGALIWVTLQRPRRRLHGERV